MKTYKDHSLQLVKSEQKVNSLAIILKLKQETANRMRETQNEYLKRILLESTYTME